MWKADAKCKLQKQDSVRYKPYAIKKQQKENFERQDSCNVKIAIEGLS